MYTYNRKAIRSDGKSAAVARCWVLGDTLAERAGNGGPAQVGGGRRSSVLVHIC
jgi:hypothetical protein